VHAQARRQAIVQPLIESVTQREKFLLADRLGRPYSEIMEDPDRVMIALLWIKTKRDAGGVAPKFDDLLDLTDAEILDRLGLDDDDAEGLSGNG
jgi:hypothetical protein